MFVRGHYDSVTAVPEMKRSQFLESVAANSLEPVMLEVRTRFVADFPIRCDLAASLIDGTLSPETRKDSAESLRALAHRIAGLAGMVGFGRVSALASNLEEAAGGIEAAAIDQAAAHALVDSLREAFAQELAGPEPEAPLEAPDKPHRGHVLIAEDDEDQRALVLRILADAGYSTEGVSSGALVMNAARATHPSVVLLDVEMPGLDGYSACRELKADPALARVPVVFMTSRARLDDKLAGLTLGADDYLIKPIDPRELIVRLDRVRTRDTARAEQAGASGVMSYEDFLLVARSRLTRAAAAVVLVRVPAEQLATASTRVRDEVRRMDLVAIYDRTHLLLLLPEMNGSSARARTTAVIRGLEESGIDDAAAGVAVAPRPNAIWIESLICDADAALLQARQSGQSVAVFGEALEPAAAPVRARSVLVADDDPDVMRIVDAQLRGAGYQTRLAFDGSQALAALEVSKPDVLILDLIMPKLGGFDLLSRLKGSDGPRPKTVVLSARGREDDVTRAFELGADDYMTKPFNPQELLARIARLLR